MRGIAACCLAVSLVALLGWVLDVPFLTRGFPSLPRMQPDTALGLAFASTALLLPSGLGGLSVVFGLSAALLGIGPLVGYACTGEHVPYTVPGGTRPMAPQTAIGLVAIGLANAARRFRPTASLVEPFALLAAIPAYLSLVSLLFAGTVTAFPLVTTMSLPTSSVVIALAGALIGHAPDRGIAALLRSRGPGGELARAFLPLAFVLPPALGLLRVVGEDLGLYDTPFGVSLMITAMAVALTAVTVVLANRIDRVDAAREEVAGRFRRLVETTPEGIGIVDPAGRLTYANDQLLALLGMSSAGIPVEARVTPSARKLFNRFLRRAARTPTRFGAVVDLPGGACRFLRFSGTPLPRQGEGEPDVVVVVMDDTARRLAGDRLRAHARDLARVTRDLEQFVVLVSHDLKEPLRKLQILSDRTATFEPPPAPEIVDLLARIRRAACTMQARVDGLQGWSHLSSEMRPPEPVELDAVLRAVRDVAEARLAERGGVLDVGPLPRVSGDPALLRRMFVELVDNAVQFARPGVPPVVRIVATASPGSVTVRVSDNGPGIDARHGERAFRMFATLTPGAGGLGLGLACVRRIVELHGGSIELGTAPGGGAAFTIRLPAAPPPVPCEEKDATLEVTG